MIGVVGLNYWGPNLARNFADLGALSWLCDLDDERLAAAKARHPDATATSSYDELLASDVAGVVIATDHHSIDYGALVDRAQLVVDLRNATGKKGTESPNVFKL